MYFFLVCLKIQAIYVLIVILLFQLVQEIFPVSTYTCLGLTVIMFLVTDYLRYKPIVVLDAISSFTVQILLIFTQSKTDMMVGW